MMRQAQQRIHRYRAVDMRLGDFLKKAGSTALKTAFPRASGAIEAISGIVGEKLTGDETGDEIALKLTPAQLDREIDLKIVESNNYAEVAIAQEMNNGSTRPKIAQQMSDLFCHIAYASFGLIVVAIGGDAATESKHEFTKIVTTNLHWIIGALAVPALGIVQQYYVRRSDDKRNAHSAGSGMPLPPNAGIFSKIKDVFR